MDAMYEELCKQDKKVTTPKQPIAPPETFETMEVDKMRKKLLE